MASFSVGKILAVFRHIFGLFARIFRWVAKPGSALISFLKENSVGRIFAPFVRILFPIFVGLTISGMDIFPARFHDLVFFWSWGVSWLFISWCFRGNIVLMFPVYVLVCSYPIFLWHFLVALAKRVNPATVLFHDYIVGVLYFPVWVATAFVGSGVSWYSVAYFFLCWLFFVKIPVWIYPDLSEAIVFRWGKSFPLWMIGALGAVASGVVEMVLPMGGVVLMFAQILCFVAVFCIGRSVVTGVSIFAKVVSAFYRFAARTPFLSEKKAKKKSADVGVAVRTTDEGVSEPVERPRENLRETAKEADSGRGEAEHQGTHESGASSHAGGERTPPPSDTGFGENETYPDGHVVHPPEVSEDGPEGAVVDRDDLLADSAMFSEGSRVSSDVMTYIDGREQESAGHEEDEGGQGHSEHSGEDGAHADHVASFSPAFHTGEEEDVVFVSDAVRNEVEEAVGLLRLAVEKRDSSGVSRLQCLWAHHQKIWHEGLGQESEVSFDFLRMGASVSAVRSVIQALTMQPENPVSEDAVVGDLAVQDESVFVVPRAAASALPDDMVINGEMAQILAEQWEESVHGGVFPGMDPGMDHGLGGSREEAEDDGRLTEAEPLVRFGDPKTDEDARPHVPEPHVPESHVDHGVNDVFSGHEPEDAYVVSTPAKYDVPRSDDFADGDLDDPLADEVGLEPEYREGSEPVDVSGDVFLTSSDVDPEKKYEVPSMGVFNMEDEGRVFPERVEGSFHLTCSMGEALAALTVMDVVCAREVFAQNVSPLASLGFDALSQFFVRVLTQAGRDPELCDLASRRMVSQIDQDCPGVLKLPGSDVYSFVAGALKVGAGGSGSDGQMALVDGDRLVRLFMFVACRDWRVELMGTVSALDDQRADMQRPGSLFTARSDDIAVAASAMEPGGVDGVGFAPLLRRVLSWGKEGLQSVVGKSSERKETDDIWYVISQRLPERGRIALDSLISLVDVSGQTQLAVTNDCLLKKSDNGQYRFGMIRHDVAVMALDFWGVLVESCADIPDTGGVSIHETMTPDAIARKIIGEDVASLVSEAISLKSASSGISGADVMSSRDQLDAERERVSESAREISFLQKKLNPPVEDKVAELWKTVQHTPVDVILERVRIEVDEGDNVDARFRLPSGLEPVTFSDGAKGMALKSGSAQDLDECLIYPIDGMGMTWVFNGSLIVPIKNAWVKMDIVALLESLVPFCSDRAATDVKVMMYNGHLSPEVEEAALARRRNGGVVPGPNVLWWHGTFLYPDDLVGQVNAVSCLGNMSGARALGMFTAK